MRRAPGWAVLVAVTVALTGCAVGESAEPSSDQNSPAAPTSSATPTPSDTDDSEAAPAVHDADDDQPDQPIGDHGDDEPTPPSYDVDAAAPTIVTATIARDVTVRYGANDMITVSPRSFVVASSGGSTTVTVDWHLIGAWGYHFNSPEFVVAPGTWTPATSCGSAPTDAVPMSSINSAIASVYYGNDFALASQFVTNAAGPWYLVMRDDGCNLAAWTVPASGASR